MVLVKSNQCRLCPKVFCCSDCREEHERAKHPPPKCAICLNEPLPFLPYSDKLSRDKSELFCHLVFNHLPLHCKLCGDQFNDNQDLAKAKLCKGWLRKSKKKEVPCTEVGATPASGLQQQQQQGATKKQLLKPDASRFDSPPELVRQTSTPVHQQPGLHPTSSLFKQISAPPHFVLPNTPSPGPLVDSLHNTNYYTPETTLPKQNDNRANQSRAEQSSASSGGVPSYSSLKSLKRANDSVVKRVRFSDQCQPIMSSTPSTSALDNSSNDDVFFEAKESLDQPSPGACNDCYAPDKNSLAPSCNENNNNNIINSNNNIIINSNNNNNNNNNEDEAGAKSVISSTVEGKKTSRVLMMLLVEQTDSTSLSSLDLRPLIDSGLKKLQESADSVGNSLEALDHKNSSKGSHVEQRLSGAEVRGKPSEQQQQQPGASASERIERSVSSPPAGQQSAEASDSGGLVSFKSDGLFSVMARAFRSAFNSLPAAVATARSLSREPVSQIGYSSPDVTAEMSYSIANSQVVLQRTTTKRSRAESHDESPHATAYDSPGQSSNGSNSSSGSSSGAVLSPVAKRPRGWYRIRGRQPIARMRQLSSPRGTSLETQRFQQGQLTVRDTQLPLPSRAHDPHQTARRHP